MSETENNQKQGESRLSKGLGYVASVGRAVSVFDEKLGTAVENGAETVRAGVNGKGVSGMVDAAIGNDGDDKRAEMGPREEKAEKWGGRVVNAVAVSSIFTAFKTALAYPIVCCAKFFAVKKARNTDEKKFKSDLEQKFGQPFNSQQWKEFKDVVNVTPGICNNDQTRTQYGELKRGLLCLDINKDGVVTKDEIRAFKTPEQLIAFIRAEGARSKLACKNSKVSAPIIRKVNNGEYVKEADLNNNDVIDDAEQQAFAKAFDLNNDGKVDSREINAMTGSRAQLAAYFQKNGGARSA